MATKASMATTTTNGHVSADDLTQSVPQPMPVPERTAEKILAVVEAIARLERERNLMIELAQDMLGAPDGWQLTRMPDGGLAFVERAGK